MFDRFTDRARKVMALARKEALSFNHNFIGTEHILLGLIQEGSGVAANVLKNLGAEIDKIRREIEKNVQSGPSIVTMGQLPFTPRSKKVLELSMEEANDRGDNHIGTEHLLLGLVSEIDGVAAQVLLDLNLKPEDVRAEVLKLCPAAGAMPHGQGTSPARTLRAQSFDLVDAAGKTRASLHVTREDQPALVFFDEHGVPCYRLVLGAAVDGAPRLQVTDGNGITVWSAPAAWS